MLKNCEICNNFKISTVIELSSPAFIHYDFTKIANQINYIECNYCKIIKIKRKKNIDIKKIFKSKNYSKSNQAHSYKIGGKKKLLKKRSEHQVDLIKKYFGIKKKLRFLDIGCFDGTLLHLLKKNFSESVCYGHDINFNFIKEFNNKKNFFFIKKLNSIKVKFDCIILSHSLMYFRNLKDTLRILYNLLKCKGKIIIQIPNIKKNIFYCLMGDQNYIFTEENLKNAFNIEGFKLTKSEKYFHNESFLIFDKKKIFKPTKLKKTNFSIKKIINEIKIKKKQIEKYDLKVKKKYIFGTNVDSAFFDEILNDKNVSFIDEKKKGKFFRSKKIIALNKANYNLPIIISKNLSSTKIYKKIKNKFKEKVLSI